MKFIECSWYLGVSGISRKAIQAARMDAVWQSADILEAKAHFGAERFSDARARTAPAPAGASTSVCKKLGLFRIARAGSAIEIGGGQRKPAIPAILDPCLRKKYDAVQ
ncbi:hypothetical protein ABC383_14825 [Noviherbaspirillum sp. 1P10PC]|uniref:hypothetical protein n=1 Tax=Noviherbaspirillum sp. 1P10PC TaxID=3132292 RepID=UPI0039A1F719